MSYATYLEYTMSPSPVTNGETQDLTIIGTLKTKEQLGVTLASVTIKQIVLDFGEVGTGSTNLTDTAFSSGDIQSPKNWTSTVSGVRCGLIPSAPSEPVTESSALVFVIKSVPVNREQGNVTLTVSEAATPTPQSGGEPPTTTPDDPGVESITLPKVAGSVTKPTLTAEPQIISPGGETTLSWSGGNPDDTYELQYMSLEGGSLTTITKHKNGNPLIASDQYPDPNLTPPDPELTLEETSIFILSYKGSKDKNSVETFVLVTGSAPVIKTFEVLPDETPVTLLWEVTSGNPDASINVNFTMDPPDSDLHPASGQKTFDLTKQSQTITLTATDTTSGKKSEKSVNVYYGYHETSVLSQNDFHLWGPCSIAFVDNYAYVANLGNSITLLDVSTPASPALVTVLDDASFQFRKPGSFSIHNSHAYVTNYLGDSITVLDVSVPASPTLARVLDDASFQISGPNSIAFAGNYAYVVNMAGFSVTVMDISTPASPTLVTVLDDANFQFYNPTSITVAGSHAYVICYQGNTITVLDVSVPADPRLVKVLDGTSFQFKGPASIAFIDNFAYVANLGNIVTILDVSSPASPELAKVLDGTKFQFNESNFITIMGTYAYVFNGLEATVTVLDVSAPSDPTLITVLNQGKIQYQCSGFIAVSENHMYVLNQGNNSITVLEIPVPHSWY